MLVMNNINKIFQTENVQTHALRDFNLTVNEGDFVSVTGPSGSGKTTIAIALEQKLKDKGFLTQVLDGDNVRTGINNNLGFSVEDRAENIRRIAEVSKLFINCGVITINCFVSPTIEIREQAKNIIGESDFIEVFVNTPIEICEKRDVKGLYKKARAGEVKDFTGISAPYEEPLNPELTIDSSKLTVEESTRVVLNYLEEKGYVKF